MPGSIEVRANEMERALIGQDWGFGWATLMVSIERAAATTELASKSMDEACLSHWAEALGAVWGKAPGFRRRIHFQGSSLHYLQRC